MPVSVKLGPRVDQHIFGKAYPAQSSLSALHSADGAFVAGGHYDHQIHIAVFGGSAPSVRAEEPDLLGLKFRFQSFDRLFQKARLNCLHGIEISTMDVNLKARLNDLRSNCKPVTATRDRRPTTSSRAGSGAVCGRPAIRLPPRPSKYLSEKRPGRGAGRRASRFSRANQSSS